MNLRELLQDFAPGPVPSVAVSGLACHSKQVRTGEVFVAVRGASQDGHAFIEEAVGRGAAAIVAERAPARALPCPLVTVSDTKRLLPAIAARWFGEPAQRLRVVGVTGTCGKTTTVYLLRAILQEAGRPAGLLGTVAYEIGARRLPSGNTTPGAMDLQRFLSQMVRQGLGWCVMEVSSHALDQGRIDGLQFDAAVFTCLGSDHLDYHQTLERYAEAKRRIFSYVKAGGYAVVNGDDAYGRILLEDLRSAWRDGSAGPVGASAERVLSYGVDPSAAIGIEQAACTWAGTELVLRTPWGLLAVRSPLLGRHNAMNVAAACGTALALGVSRDTVQRAIAAFPQVPGRLERIHNDAGIHAVVDFAHTADSLQLVLLTLRELVRGRVIVVFGCGGDRDRSKRPAMGRVASLLADHVVLTSDNPRSEDPTAIIEQIRSGLVSGFTRCQVVVDREHAILTALALARPEDAVLVAGKGHEAQQIFERVTVPFSDRSVIERFFARTTGAVSV